MALRLPSSSALEFARHLPARLSVLAILVPGHLGQAEEAKAPLTILIDSSQSLASLDVDGKPRQYTIDILRQAAMDAGIAVDFRFLPWQRAYRQAMKGPDICLAGFAQIVPRQVIFQWVGPLASPTVSLFGLKERGLHLSTMAEVIDKGYRVGIAQNDIAEALKTEFPQLRIDLLRSQDLGPKMLAAQRIDLWIASTAPGAEDLRRDGVDAEDVLKIMQLDIGLGCSPSTDGGKLAALKASIESVKNRQSGAAAQSFGLQAGTSFLGRLRSQH